MLDKVERILLRKQGKILEYTPRGTIWEFQGNRYFLSWESDAFQTGYGWLMEDKISANES